MRQITISCKDNQLFFLAIQRNFLFWKKKKLFLHTRKKRGRLRASPKGFFVRNSPAEQEASGRRHLPDVLHDQATLHMAKSRRRSFQYFKKN